MPVDEARHQRARKPRYTGPPHSRTPECDRPQLIVNLLEESRSESTADP